MSITPITSHVIAAKDRLFEQFKGVASIEALVEAFVGEVQVLENLFGQICADRGIESAVGVQLDLLGDIVGQARLGTDDDTYRQRIKVRIIQNLSEGEPERVIQVYRFLLNATTVFYGELHPASVFLVGAGSVPPGQEASLVENIQRILPVTVTLAYIAHADPERPFKYAGIQPIGRGYGSIYDVTVGGKYASLY